MDNVARVGQIWLNSINNLKYTLKKDKDGYVSLWRKPRHGREVYWTVGVEVNNPENITSSEWEKITTSFYNDRWTLIG